MRSFFNKTNMAALMVGIMFFLLIKPYFVWSWILLTYGGILMDLVLMLFLWTQIRRLSPQNLLMIICFLFVLFIMALQGQYTIIGIIAILVYAIIPFIKPSFMKDSYGYLVNIYAFVIGLSLIVWTMVQIGIPVPSTNIAPLNALKPYDYLQYPFLVIPSFSELSVDSALRTFRFCGPFDEPGVVGTMGALMLYIGKYNIRKWQYLIILLSGFASMSLFFYASTAIYLFYYIFVNKVRFIYRLLVICGIVSFYILTQENEIVSNLIYERVKWDNSSNSIAGDNRAHENLQAYYELIKGTHEYYWGVGDRELLKTFNGSASYKNAVLEYGLIPCLLYLIFFICLAYQRIGLRREFFLFVGIFLITLFQRPGFLISQYIFLFSMLIEMYARDRNTTIPKSSVHNSNYGLKLSR